MKFRVLTGAFVALLAALLCSGKPAPAIAARAAMQPVVNSGINHARPDAPRASHTSRRPDLARHDRRYAQAVAVAKRGDYAQAIRLFNRLLRQFPRFSQGFAARALAWHNLGRNNHALVDAGRAIRLDPANATARTVYGIVELQLGKPRQAVADFAWVVKHEPDNINARLLRGSAYFALSQYRRAISDLSGVIARDPTEGSAYYLRGLSEQHLGLKTQASKDIARARQLGAAPGAAPAPGQDDRNKDDNNPNELGPGSVSSPVVMNLRGREAEQRGE
jgi:tetratricopeptide (TPR) repeat protein